MYLQQSYNFKWLKMFKISLSAGRKAELQLAAMYLGASEKRPATTYWGRPFRPKAVLEL
jgi:hypothetical protein